MALTKNVTLKNNFGEDSVFGNAYIRVDKVIAGKASMVASVAFYKAKDGAAITTQQHECPVDLDGGNFIKQAYEHIKTLPEFAGAVDC